MNSTFAEIDDNPVLVYARGISIQRPEDHELGCFRVGRPVKLNPDGVCPECGWSDVRHRDRRVTVTIGDLVDLRDQINKLRRQVSQLLARP